MDDWVRKQIQKAMMPVEPASPSHPQQASDPSPPNSVADRLRQMTQAMRPQAAQHIANDREEFLEKQLRLEHERIRVMRSELDSARNHAMKLVDERATLTRLLLSLLEGMKLHGVTAPGYDEALAYFVQEQMTNTSMAPGIGGIGGSGGGGGEGTSGFLSLHYETGGNDDD